MRRFWLVLLLGAAVWTVAGCGMSQDMQSAQTVARGYLAAIQAKDTRKALSFWDTRFFQKGFTQDEWRKVLDSLPKKLGEMKAYKQVGWRISKQATTRLTGTMCTLGYEVTYTKYPAQETIVLFRPSNGKDFKVAGHNINSKGLLLN